MRTLILTAALLASPAAAQLSIPPGTTATDPVAQAQAAQALTAAQAAQNAAAAACVATPAVPSMEAVGGAAGTNTGQCRPVNSVQPRISRTVAFTTGSNGQATVTWQDMGAVPLVFVVPNNASASTQAPVCTPVAGTITSTGATVKCFTTQTVTVSILGAVVAPITTAGAGVTGQVLALPAS